jgi:hypothetical protein
MGRPVTRTWMVGQDVALHLLVGDLSRLSRGRDADSAGILSKAQNSAAFSEMLAAKNQRWTEATHPLSGRVIQDLRAYSTADLNDWTARADLLTPSIVRLARLRPETDRNLGASAADPRCRRSPHQHLAVAHGPAHHRLGSPAPVARSCRDRDHSDGRMDAGGAWQLTAEGADRWTHQEHPDRDAVASVAFTSDAAWRSFTGAALPANGVRRSGPDALTQPFCVSAGSSPATRIFRDTRVLAPTSFRREPAGQARVAGSQAVEGWPSSNRTRTPKRPRLEHVT